MNIFQRLWENPAVVAIMAEKGFRAWAATRHGRPQNLMYDWIMGQTRGRYKVFVSNRTWATSGTHEFLENDVPATEDPLPEWFVAWSEERQGVSAGR